MNYFTNDDIMRLESKAAKIRKEVVKMLCMAKGTSGWFAFRSRNTYNVILSYSQHRPEEPNGSTSRPLCIIQRTWKSDIVYDSC